MARTNHAPTPPDDAEVWAGNLPDEYLLCRDMGHTWRPYRAGIDGDHNTYQRTMRCGRCKCERDQTLSMSGHPLASSYRYPEGYTAPKGMGHIDGGRRDGLRLESILRLLGKDENDGVRRVTPAPFGRVRAGRRRAS